MIASPSEEVSVRHYQGFVLGSEGLIDGITFVNLTYNITVTDGLRNGGNTTDSHTPC